MHRMRDGTVRVREGHRSVVSGHDVEGVVPERHRLGACIQQREVDAGFGHQPPSMVELAGREVEAERSGAGSRQGDGPLSAPHRELQDVLARDVAQHLQLPPLGSGRSPKPGHRSRPAGRRARLVLVAEGVPRGAVSRGVRRQAGVSRGVRRQAGDVRSILVRIVVRAAQRRDRGARSCRLVRVERATNVPPAAPDVSRRPGRHRLYREDVVTA